MYSHARLALVRRFIQGFHTRCNRLVVVLYLEVSAQELPVDTAASSSSVSQFPCFLQDSLKLVDRALHAASCLHVPKDLLVNPSEKHGNMRLDEKCPRENARKHIAMFFKILFLSNVLHHNDIFCLSSNRLSDNVGGRLGRAPLSALLSFVPRSMASMSLSDIVEQTTRSRRYLVSALIRHNRSVAVQNLNESGCLLARCLVISSALMSGQQV